MTAQDLVIEILHKIQTDLAELNSNDNRIEVRLSAIESHINGFLITQGVQQETLDYLRKRVQTIEKRLDLID